MCHDHLYVTQRSWRSLDLGLMTLSSGTNPIFLGLMTLSFTEEYWNSLIKAFSLGFQCHSPFTVRSDTVLVRVLTRVITSQVLNGQLLVSSLGMTEMTVSQTFSIITYRSDLPHELESCSRWWWGHLVSVWLTKPDWLYVIWSWGLIRVCIS